MFEPLLAAVREYKAAVTDPPHERDHLAKASPHRDEPVLVAASWCSSAATPLLSRSTPQLQLMLVLSAAASVAGLEPRRADWTPTDHAAATTTKLVAGADGPDVVTRADRRSYL